MTRSNLPDRCLCGSLRRATRAVSRLYDDVLVPSGLRITQYSVLSACARLGEPTTAALAADLAMERTTLVRNLRPLEERGLIVARALAGSRSHRLALTVAGRRALRSSEPLWQRAQALAQARFGADTMAALSRLALDVARAGD